MKVTYELDCKLRNAIRATNQNRHDALEAEKEKTRAEIMPAIQSEYDGLSDMFKKLIKRSYYGDSDGLINRIADTYVAERYAEATDEISAEENNTFAKIILQLQYSKNFEDIKDVFTQNGLVF